MDLANAITDIDQKEKQKVAEYVDAQIQSGSITEANAQVLKNAKSLSSFINIIYDINVLDDIFTTSKYQKRMWKCTTDNSRPKELIMMSIDS